jgi:hypothetical protein
VSQALNQFERYKNGGERGPNGQFLSQSQQQLAKQQQQPQQNLAQQQPEKFQRSYEGLNQQEAKIFSDMSTSAYKQLYPIYLESKQWKAKEEAFQKQLAEAQQTTSYDQEGAWQLSPDYKNLSQSAARLNFETQFCQAQLENLESGQDIVWITSYDQNGNPQYTQPFKPTSKDRAMILGTLAKANQMSMDANNKLQQFEGSYKEKHTGYIQGLQSVRSQLFQGIDLQKLETAAKSKLEQFPSHVRSKPEVKLLAESMVIFDGMQRMIQDLQSQLGGRQVQQRTATNAGPSGQTIQTGGKTTETVGDFISRVKKMKEQHANA